MSQQPREYTKPLPRPTPISEPFWRGAREGQLLLQHCRVCGQAHFYPRPFCTTCLSEELEWRKACGRGTVYSFTVVRRAANRAFEPDLPYVFAAISLAEGPRLAGNIIGLPPDAVRVGMPVEAVFIPATPEVTLIKWRPSGG